MPMERALRNRLTFGPLMLAGLVGVLWLDWYVERVTTSPPIKGVGITLLLLLLCPLAVREVAVLFTAERVKPFRTIAVLGSGALLVHAFLTQFPQVQRISGSSLALIVVGVMLAGALQRAIARQSQDAIVAMAGTVLAVLYLGGLAWFLVALRVKEGDLFYTPFKGTTWHVVMILLAVKFTDIGAFFTGRAIGRHKLIPWLSPGKTWEGLAGGLATAGVVGAICAPNIVDLSYAKGALFGVLIGGVGQLGDLLESMFKRDAEVKDSGTLLPGFGGVLDVMDSPLLAAPFAYVLFSLF